MSTSIRNAFIFYDLVLFLSAGVGVYFNKHNPILGFFNGVLVGAVVCIILYNIYKDRLTVY